VHNYRRLKRHTSVPELLQAVRQEVDESLTAPLVLEIINQEQK
jgi:hypothetical protein